MLRNQRHRVFLGVCELEFQPGNPCRLNISCNTLSLGVGLFPCVSFLRKRASRPRSELVDSWMAYIHIIMIQALVPLGLFEPVGLVKLIVNLAFHKVVGIIFDSIEIIIIELIVDVSGTAGLPRGPHIRLHLLQHLSLPYPAVFNRLLVSPLCQSQDHESLILLRLGVLSTPDTASVIHL